MSRPVTLLKDNTIYWIIRVYNSSQVLVDADSTPTVAVRKNGSSVADVVTVTKRASTTGIYDCYYNPAGEAEGDQFCIEETVTVSSQDYENSWSFVIEEAERGTDNASTFDATSDTVTTDSASRTASQADVSLLATSASISALNDISQADVRTAVGLASANLDTQLGDIPTVSEFEARTLIAASYFDPSTDTVTTDAASRTASQADVSSLATAASIAALNDFNPSTDTVANVTTTGSVTNAVTTDTASRTASQADVSGLATASALSSVSTNVSSAKGVTDKLDTAVQLDGAVWQFTTNALERAPSSGAGGVVGPGAISHTVTVNSGGNPVDGAEVWVTTDAAGNSVIAGTLVTDAFGQVTFTLDAGTYYLWAQKAGVNFTNPVSFEVE